LKCKEKSAERREGKDAKKEGWKEGKIEEGKTMHSCNSALVVLVLICTKGDN
jgi:hypothetical protein